jgi:hypothetical protein
MIVLAHLKKDNVNPQFPFPDHRRQFGKMAGDDLQRSRFQNFAREPDRSKTNEIDAIGVGRLKRSAVAASQKRSKFTDLVSLLDQRPCQSHRLTRSLGPNHRVARSYEGGQVNGFCRDFDGHCFQFHDLQVVEQQQNSG